MTGQWTACITINSFCLFLMWLSRPSPCLLPRPGLWSSGLQFTSTPFSSRLCCSPAACRGPTDYLRPFLLLPGQAPLSSDPLFTCSEAGPLICPQLTPDKPGLELEGPSLKPLLGEAEGTLALVLQLVQKLWLLGLGHVLAPGVKKPRGRPHQLPDPALSWGRGSGPGQRNCSEHPADYTPLTP